MTVTLFAWLHAPVPIPHWGATSWQFAEKSVRVLEENDPFVLPKKGIGSKLLLSLEVRCFHFCFLESNAFVFSQA